MHILVVGNPQNLDECRQKFGTEHGYSVISDRLGLEEAAIQTDVVFDFLGHTGLAIKLHKQIEKPYFIDVSRMSLGSHHGAVGDKILYLFGFAGLPTFLNRQVLEVSCKPDQAEKLRGVCEGLVTGYQIVADRVGLVTPRVICMIINEAFYALQEGIATRDDIDLAMKLGTNYPKGPFEWCRLIGVQNVCNLLEAVYADTMDSRYRVCPLLKTENLEN